MQSLCSQCELCVIIWRLLGRGMQRSKRCKTSPKSALMSQRAEEEQTELEQEAEQKSIQRQRQSRQK